MATLAARLRRERVGTWYWLGLLLLIARPTAAQELSGTYRPSPTTVTASVTTWGEDCGPRPVSETLSAPRDITVQHSEGQLTLQFPGYALRSNGCWSANPAVRRVSHSSTGTQWRTDCSTPDADSKRELARYTIQQKSATQLELINESEYLWQLKGSTCTAKVRSVQQLQRLDVPASSGQAPDAAVAPSCTFNRVERIKLRPSEATLEPAQRVCFSVRAFDAEGCTKELKASDVSWSLDKKDALRASLSGGCFRAADSAAEAEGAFRVSATFQGKRDQAAVQVRIADLSDITARRTSNARTLQTAEDGAQGGLASSGVKALGIETDSPWSVLLGSAALLVLLGVAAWWFLSRGSAPSIAARPPERAPAARPVERLSVRPSAAPPSDTSHARAAPALPPTQTTSPTRVSPVAPQEAMVCPACRRGYGANSTHCETDGAQLLTYTAFVQRSMLAPSRTCRGCGETLAANVVFCGACGHRNAE